ncbi:MAG: CHASE2 domain-containing protein [Thermodesulfobacteriota bacterium]
MATLRSRAAVPVIALLALLLAATDFWGVTERYIYDLHARLDAGPEEPRDIVIVAIDDATLDVLADLQGGLKYPYPRSLHATVLEKLAEFGATAVFFDILFDLPSGFGEADDRRFEQALNLVPTVLAAELDRGVSSPPLERFVRQGAIPGNAIVPVDMDGVVRDMFGGAGIPKGFCQSLDYFCGGWRIRRPPAGEVPKRLPAAPERLLNLTSPGAIAPPPGMIRYFGGPGCFRTLSFFELCDDNLAEGYREDLRGKTVFIGRALYAPLTPGQQSDLFLTPYRPGFTAGVEIHANVFASLSRNRVIRLLPAAAVPPLFLIWILTCLVVSGRFTHPAGALASMTVLLSALEGAAFLLFRNDIVLLLGPFLFFAVLHFLYATVTAYIRERDGRLLIRTQLFRYLPERVARHMLAEPFRMAMAGDRSEITVLFADLAGFTTLSEELPTDTVITLLQRHLKDMTEVIFAHEGTLDKFLGDGVMAFWGAPEPQENQADMAIRAALAMLTRVEEANRERCQTGLPSLTMRIGLHSGEAVVGNIGSDLYIDYTAIGDTVNTASRTEGINKFFGTRLLVSDACLKKTRQNRESELCLVGRVSVKGKKIPVSFFTPAGPDEEEAYGELARILDLLDRLDVKTAGERCRRLLKEKPEFGPAVFHLDRLENGDSPLHMEGIGHYWPLDKK